jgi:hypothetical protein
MVVSFNQMLYSPHLRRNQISIPYSNSTSRNSIKFVEVVRQYQVITSNSLVQKEYEGFS